MNPELERLATDSERKENWKRWGPYLSERQWGTVREDYSSGRGCWDYLPHDHARSRAYRWGEDGLLGIIDRECRLCFALALWNGEGGQVRQGRVPVGGERAFLIARSRRGRDQTAVRRGHQRLLATVSSAQTSAT
jgi:hypothetical protein